MSAADSDSESDSAHQESGPPTKIRLFLRASNLPKSIINQEPDTLARISYDVGDDGAGGDNEDSSLHQNQLLDETEVVYKSSNPRWTASFAADYSYGSQLLFFVDVFSVHTNGSSGISASMGRFVNKQGLKFLGRAVFDVQDVLGGKKHIKARRLRKGGVVYAHVEQQSLTSAPTSRSLSLSSTASKTSDCRMLNLRLRADSLVHTHSIKSRVVPKNRIEKPDTYYEISRPSSGTWIVVYRSPAVKESVSPTWDEAAIELGSFYSASSPRSSFISSPATSGEDLSMYRIMITVYKVKRRKCKEIGSFETTVESLMGASQTMAKITGYEDEDPSNRPEEEEGDQPAFQLRPTPTGGADRSDKITGNITVVKASIDNSDEVLKQSQRFLSQPSDNDSIGPKSLCETNDDDSTASINQVMPSQPRPKFSDYVGAGLNIDFCVAIDFTSSNGDPRTPGTQHYSRDGMMNDYEEAIAAISDTIEKYSSNKEYPVWGFGAKYGGKVRHIFQCGGSATAKGTEGVLDAYRTVFETDLIMSGPSVVNSVLAAAAARSKRFYNAKTNMQYCVLLILTDGMVSNLESTQKLVRSYRDLQLPLSVIVVGIGRADFSEFHQWSGAPSDVRGRFKFVEFREHQFDPDTLSRKALQNVPQEVVNYFLQRQVLPH
ncbi:hypothetical protein ACHAXR_007319 [Thalassiosira sp. AJA248-18]